MMRRKHETIIFKTLNIMQEKDCGPEVAPAQCRPQHLEGTLKWGAADSLSLEDRTESGETKAARAPSTQHPERNPKIDRLLSSTNEHLCEAGEEPKEGVKAQCPGGHTVPEPHSSQSIRQNMQKLVENNQPQTEHCSRLTQQIRNTRPQRIKMSPVVNCILKQKQRIFIGIKKYHAPKKVNFTQSDNKVQRACEDEKSIAHEEKSI